jgi:hypothetical protein
MAEPAGDHVADALGDGDPNTVGGLRRHALDGEQPNDLAYKERVPVGLSVQRRDQPRRHDLRRRCLDVLADLALAQAGERQATGNRLPDDGGKHLA